MKSRLSVTLILGGDGESLPLVWVSVVSRGKAVASLSLGPMAAGTQTFSWNGTGANGTQLTPGTYTFKVTAVTANGSAVPATSLAVVPVTSVTLGGSSGPLLDLGGGLAPVPISAVQQVF